MVQIDTKNIRKIYFVGIKGVGMASLAVIAKEAGFIVQGSDISEEFITDKILLEKDIHIDSGFEREALKRFVNGNTEETLVISTAAHGGLENPQCKYALQNHINVMTHGQAVGYFMNGALLRRSFKGISILGCHGKTTITAMCATAFVNAGFDPTYSVGTSELFPVGLGGNLGNGEYFIAEADEFVSDVKKDRTVKFLYQHPEYAIINNIDFDHPDVYKDLQDVKDTFFKFIFENIKVGGTLIYNGDDNILQEVKKQNAKGKIESKNLKVVSYGEGAGNDFQIVKFEEKGWGSEFEVIARGLSLGSFSLSVPGYHNAKNALSVIGLMHELKVPIDQIKKGIAEFLGTKRRQEKLGVTKNGAMVIDDYAHHPDEIEKTIEAVKNAYPEKQIAVLFQPHTLSRTKALMTEFAHAFKKADSVVFLPIFTSKREQELNYDEIYDSIKKTMQKAGSNVEFLPDLRSGDEFNYSPYLETHARESVVEYVNIHFDSNEWVVLLLGAGDLYRIGYDMVKGIKG